MNCTTNYLNDCFFYRTTIVESYSLFWIGVESEPLEIQVGFKPFANVRGIPTQRSPLLPRAQ